MHRPQLDPGSPMRCGRGKKYTAIDCGEDVCPFFLANVIAYNTTDSWEITVGTPVGALPKTISDV